MKKIYLIIAIFALLLIFIFQDNFTCLSRVDNETKSFKVCLKRMIGRDEPLPPPPEKEEIKVTILEGWNLDDIALYLESLGLFSQEEFIEASLKDYDYGFLADKPEGHSLEGYLFPDTYRLFIDASAEDVIKKMLNNFDKRLSNDLREEIKRQEKTIFEVINLAALVEKEAPIDYKTGNNEDAKIVAGIFNNRLKSGQALQACASLAYILGEIKPIYSEADTKINSPYNTYLNSGLPYGPIANPGLLAIEAVIYPTETDYNYFLTPIGTKEMIYSTTYQEHLINRDKYLR
jgi:UPF0755 protein